MSEEFGVFDGLSDAVVVASPERRALYVNSAFCDLYGGAPSSWRDEACPIDADPDGARPFTGRTKAGATVEWLASALPDGRTIYVGRRAAAGKGPADSEAPHARLMNFAKMAHELRTPLNGIMGLASLLLDTQLEASQRTYVSAILDSGSSMAAFINDVLDYAKFAADKLEIANSSFDLRALVQGVTELLSPLATQKGIEIASFVDPRTPKRVSGDEARLRQVLLNLAGNAVKFTERGGVTIEIHVEASAPDYHYYHCPIRIDVRDTGIGIADEHKAMLFEEFTQAHAGRAVESTGLGLAIVRKIVTAMNGKVLVESKVGVGSVFSAALTLGVEERAQDHLPTLKDPSRMIVIATRSLVLRRHLELELRAAGAQAVACASTPSQAAAALQAEQRPMLLCDLDIAAEGGIRLTRIASASYVLLTPATRGRIDSFKRLGFRGYLIKPIRAVTLIGLLNEASSAEPSATVAPPPAAPRNAMRFLVGDSESSSAALCKIVLETAGHSVEIVEDCAAAICALSSGRFELAFLDARTLKLDDPKSVAAIRAYCDSGSATPIIVLAAEQRETVEACRKAGILEAFDGPISIEKLEAMVTRRRAGADAEAARIAS